MPSVDAELVVISSDLNDWNDCSSSSSPLASLSSEGCFHTGPGGGGSLAGAAVTSTTWSMVIQVDRRRGWVAALRDPDQAFWVCVHDSATGLMNTYGA